VTALPDRRIVIPALGIAQIFAWGSTFYLLGVLAPLIVSDMGWSYDLVVAGVSIGLLIAGLASPRVGLLIARVGGRRVLATGAVLLAAGLTTLGVATSIPVYLLGWAIIGVGMSASLYDAAFSTLGSLYGAQARSAISVLTLLGGFASTVCWPLSALLAAHLGWRGACIGYALLQIVVAFPTHLLTLPRVRRDQTEATASVPTSLSLITSERWLFLVLAAVLTIAAAILSTVGTHLLPILMARGVDPSVAVGLGTIIGPSQVGARLIETIAGTRYDPVWTMVASAVLVAVAAFMLMFDLSVVALAIVLYGAGNGIGSIARGTVPLALFGPERYPVLMGRLALPLLVAMAVSPFIGGLAFQRGGPQWNLALLAAIASSNVVLVALLRIMTLRRASELER
jgi:predicted MFS family arabinose efflux permease